MTYSVGDLLHVINVDDDLDFFCIITEVKTDSRFHEDVACVYLARWEAAQNPDVGPMVSIWEFTDGKFGAVDESAFGFGFRDVEVTKNVK